jgi:hypothetical protein
VNGLGKTFLMKVSSVVNKGYSYLRPNKCRATQELCALKVFVYFPILLFNKNTNKKDIYQ